MSLESALKKFDTAAAEVLEWWKKEVASMRTSRVTPGSVNDLPVEHYGTRMPLQGMATVSSIDARTLQISPWDTSAIASIEKALTDAQLGAQPIVDGKLIRLSFAQMSEEVREATVKKLHKKAEEARIRLRQARDESLSQLTREDKEGTITEDNFYDGKKDLNERIDKANHEIEKSVKAKEVEIRTI
jgi:ribosome recycling factor